ncbi:MAG: U32 family peptidase C-terminal domain-containing protein, partial [Clostridia bacterium]|nr:U32 family peptidase C-terminal domain-containing protein [Clostridia bacterium]
EELAETARALHKMGKRFYVTVNSFAKGSEEEPLRAYARALESAKVDAAIVSDPGVIALFRKEAPGLELHLSTQANCQNHMAARVYHEMGVKRIVLARELTLSEIAGIRDKTPPDLELEVFAHGAMCMAYSGRCLISSYLAGRSGNRGSCAQPCRWHYALTEEKRPGEFFPLFEEEGKTAILSSHDLSTIAFLDEIRKTGVDAVKIEGRMKTAYYVATVTRAYRLRIDGLWPTALLEEELDAVSHRPYSGGFYFGEEAVSPTNDGLYRQTHKIAAVVLGEEDGLLRIEQRNPFALGDRLELLKPGLPGESFRLRRLTDEEGTPRENAPHPREKLLIACPFRAEKGDMLRIPCE